MTASYAFRLTDRDWQNIETILKAEQHLAGNKTAALRLALEEAAKKRRKK